MLKPIQQAVIYSMCLFLTVGVFAQEPPATPPTDNPAPVPAENPAPPPTDNPAPAEAEPTLKDVLDQIRELQSLVNSAVTKAEEAKAAADNAKTAADGAKTAADDAAAAAAAATTPPVPAAPAVRVHLLLIYRDNDPTLGQGFRASAERIQLLFAQALGNDPTAGTLSTVVTVGDNELATDANILAGLRSIPALGPQDVFVCWYFMHGGQIPQIQVLGNQQQRTAIVGSVLAQQPVNTLIDVRGAPGAFYGHMFESQDTGNRTITRINLWLAMLSKGASYTLMFSDTCFPGVRQGPAPSPAAAAAIDGAQLRRLLTQYTGRVNITSCEVGQNSWYLTRGIFTDAFYSIASSSDQNDWATFNTRVSNATSQAFQNLIAPSGVAGNQDDQNPEVFILQVSPR